MGFGWISLQFCCVVTGLIVYSKYHDCDPLTAKVKKCLISCKIFISIAHCNITKKTKLFLVGKQKRSNLAILCNGRC